MATIVVFASSLFVTTLIVLMKAIEIKYSKRNFLLKLISKLDTKGEFVTSRTKFLLLLLIQSVRYLVLVRVPMTLREQLDKIKLKILEEYRNQESLIMGQREIKNRGSVSFFLKKIDEGHKNGQGKIDEILPE